MASDYPFGIFLFHVNERGKYQRDNQKPSNKEDQMIQWSMKEENTKEIIRSHKAKKTR
jgi:hypothetical protein